MDQQRLLIDAGPRRDLCKLSTSHPQPDPGSRWQSRVHRPRIGSESEFMPQRPAPLLGEVIKPACGDVLARCASSVGAAAEAGVQKLPVTPLNEPSVGAGLRNAAVWLHMPVCLHKCFSHSHEPQHEDVRLDLVHGCKRERLWRALARAGGTDCAGLGV